MFTLHVILTRLPVYGGPFVAKNLFSTHFLGNNVKSMKEWEEDAEVDAAFIQVKKLYHESKDVLATLNESQLEDKFIRPLLRILNHHYEVQALAPSGRPDYAFFSDVDSAREALKNQGKDDFYAQTIAVGDAKVWEEPLDKFRRGRPVYERSNPSYQIDTYLRATPPRWAILTNGRYWRLYCEDTSYRGDSFYEVDLVELIQEDDSEGFKYFCLFFRKQAFEPVGRSFLDSVFAESADYAKALGEGLKENIYHAMKLIAEGFLGWPENGLSKSPSQVEIIRENTMKLLYRLLFALYAESRGLLDLSNKEYAKMSLHTLKREVTERVDKRERMSKLQRVYWNRLDDLFRLVNQGSKALGFDKEVLDVPPYNGDLFDPERNHFLRDKKVSDFHLVPAIDLLARSVEGNGKKAMIDYSTLDIRHLGSIYEGLLEFRLHIAKEDMVAVKAKGKEKWIRKEDAKGKTIDTVKAGELYLSTDSMERKASGSYYTPEYVVKYIVEKALGPIVEQRLMNSGGLRSDAILSIKVLDPAMGSGHFLVEAVDFLAKHLVEAIENDVENDLAPEGDYSSEWAKREVTAHCIYGVDRNPMAVELAKVSLWLKTISKDKPLSFLDHRLKCGDSLVGVGLEDLPKYPGQKKRSIDVGETVERFDVEVRRPFVDELLMKIDELETAREDTLSDVKHKEEVYDALQRLKEYERIKAFSDVYTSFYFGNTTGKDYYYNLLWALKGGENEWKEKTSNARFRKAERAARDNRFFHWQLEFPDVYYGSDRKVNRGFDVVIGNPPYVRQELIVPLKGYLKSNYTVYGGRVDMYAYFLEQSLRLLREGGILSFIVSRKFMNVKYGRKLREIITSSTRIDSIVDFGDLPVFEDVTSYPLIITLERGEPRPSNEVTYCKMEGLGFKSIDKDVSLGSTLHRQEWLTSDEWVFTDVRSMSLKKKIEDSGIPLADFCGEPLVGIKTGLNRVFVLNDSMLEEIVGSSAKGSELFRPFAFAKSFDRYSPVTPDSYVLFPYVRDSEMNLVTVSLENYPNVKAYLERHKTEVASRAIIKDKAPKGETKWFELQQINKNIHFEEPKIVYKDLSSDSSFTLDTTGSLVDMTAFVLESSDLYLLSLLNSSLLTWYVGLLCARARGDWYRYKTQYVNRIPIRLISSETPTNRLKCLLGRAKRLYQEYLSAENPGPLLELISELLPEEMGDGKAIGGRADVIRELLAYLADQMLGLHRSLHKEIQDFLKWLERELRTPIDKLTGKSRLAEYFFLGFDDLSNILKENRRRLPINPSNRDFQENLKREHERSIEVLNPLRFRIESTDKLIDQIVYRLYGLTEDEINLAEEFSK